MERRGPAEKRDEKRMDELGSYGRGRAGLPAGVWSQGAGAAEPEVKNVTASMRGVGSGNPL